MLIIGHFTLTMMCFSLTIVCFIQRQGWQER